MKGMLLVAAGAALATCAAARAAALPPRIGDRGSVFDPSKFDPAWPIAREFAQAGVEGGIPPRGAVLVRLRLKAGDDIQAAVDRAPPGGAVLLEPGLYRRTQPIRMKSGVVLRGSGRDSTVIEYDCTSGGEVGQAVLFRDCEGAGLEDLALRHAKVFAMDPAVYVGKYANFPDLPTGNYAAIEIVGQKTRNCWVQACAILCSASRPLRIHGGPSHITMRDNRTDRSLHKGGKGSGYYEVVGATYVLLYHETIENIRHICLDATCDYTVMVHCRVGVDINWHCIPPMRNTLVESVVARLRPGHPWPPLCHYRDPSGTDNYIYKFDAQSDKGDGGASADPSRVFTLRTNWDEKPWVYPVERPAPTTGTLYPVTGVHRPASPDDASAAAVGPLRPGVGAPPGAPGPEAAPADGDDWDRRLLARLAEETKAGRRPVFFLSLAGRQVRLVEADPAGILRTETAGRVAPAAWGRLTASDKRGLALAVARKDDPADCLLAAYFLLAAGQKDKAEEYLKGADAAAAARLRAAFK